MNAIEIRESILSWSNNIPEPFDEHVPTAGARGVLINLMNRALQPDSNTRRYKAIAWIFRDILGKPNATMISTKELTDQCWWCLVSWANIGKDADTGQWTAHGGFFEEIYACYKAMEDWESDILARIGAAE